MNKDLIANFGKVLLSIEAFRATCFCVESVCVAIPSK